MTPTLPDNWPYRNPTSERDRNEEKIPTHTITAPAPVRIVKVTKLRFKDTNQNGY